MKGLLSPLLPFDIIKITTRHGWQTDRQTKSHKDNVVVCCRVSFFFGVAIIHNENLYRLYIFSD